MGEQVYEVEGIHISFAEGDESYNCLCAFPSNGICLQTIRSLALLGSAVVLAHQEEDSGCRYLPSYVPLEIRERIDEVFYAPQEIVDMVKKIYAPYPLDAARKQRILEWLKKMGA